MTHRLRVPSTPIRYECPVEGCNRGVYTYNLEPPFDEVPTHCPSHINPTIILCCRARGIHSSIIRLLIEVYLTRYQPPIEEEAWNLPWY